MKTTVKICPDVQIENLRRLAGAVVFQALRDAKTDNPKQERGNIFDQLLPRQLNLFG